MNLNNSYVSYLNLIQVLFVSEMSLYYIYQNREFAYVRFVIVT